MLSARVAADEQLTAIEQETLDQAGLVQYAVIFDRIFRFAITGSRVRNYDGLGGQLEQLDKQRQRAEDARFLIQCFTEFNRGDTGRLERLRRTGRIEDSIRCAVVSRQLSLIVKRNESATGQSARTKIMIEAFSESLEQDLLRQFDDAYRRFKIEAMKVIVDLDPGFFTLSLCTKLMETM